MRRTPSHTQHNDVESVWRKKNVIIMKTLRHRRPTRIELLKSFAPFSICSSESENPTGNRLNQLILYPSFEWLRVLRQAISYVREIRINSFISQHASDWMNAVIWYYFFFCRAIRRMYNIWMELISFSWTLRKCRRMWSIRVWWIISKNSLLL